MVVVVVVVVILLLAEQATICLPLTILGCTICTGLLLGFCDSGSNFGIGLTTLAFFGMPTVLLATSAAVVVVLGLRTGFFFGALLAGSNFALLWSIIGATFATCFVTVVVVVADVALDGKLLLLPPIKGCTAGCG